MKKRLKINGLLMFLSTCLILVFPKFFLRRDSPDIINDLFEIFGFALVLFGLLLRVCARGYKSEYSKEGFALVNAGPYKLARNPMYLGIVMIGLGMVLVLFKWWVGVIFALIFTARYILLIFKEEKRLAEQFGAAYKDYTRSTPRIFPKAGVLQRDIREILPLKLSWVKKEIGSVISFILGILIIKSWKDISASGFNCYIEELSGFIMLIGLFFVLSLYLSGNRKDKAGGVSSQSENT